MKLMWLGIVSFLLSGCLETFKMNPPWPKISDPNLLKQCEHLKIIDTKDIAMAELIDHIQQNYQLYHLCKLNNDSWIKWYNTHWKNKEQ